jgi:hypothetical protein
MLVHTTAIHEAGHAVAACALRIKFERVVLNKARKPRPCPRTGLTNRWVGGYLKTNGEPAVVRHRMFKELPDGGFVVRTVANCARLRKRHEDFIVMLLAGREAGKLVGDERYPNDRLWAASSDYTDARQYAEDWLGISSKQECDDIIARLRVRAARLVRKKAPAVIRIAEALDEYGTLTARQAKELYQ